MTIEASPARRYVLGEEAAQALVVRLVRMEMARLGIGYRELRDALAQIGVEIDERALRNKVARGTFSGAFLLQLCHALGIENLATGVPPELALARRLVPMSEARLFQTLKGVSPEARAALPAELREQIAAWELNPPVVGE